MPLMPRGLFICVTLVTTRLISCAEPPPPSPPREPAGILYVAVPELKLHQRPDPLSRVVATYRQGESVTVYSTRGDWAEVQLIEDRTGWVRRSDLTAYKEDRGGSTTPRFRKSPSPVWSPKKAEGAIVLEASVDAQGNVMSVRTLANTTGDRGLESMNRAELLAAKFYPLRRAGRPTPFLYEYRVTY